MDEFEKQQLSRASEIVKQALELDPDQRPGFIAAECDGNEDLLELVELLLATGNPSSEFNDNSQDPNLTDMGIPSASHRIGPADQIGPYRLLEKIGEGGFGEVYAADQQTPVKRRVAVKILKAGLDSEAVLARFEAERQALAVMDHPNVAKIFDAGETEAGQPYFVMELVKGDPITEYADRHRLSTQERLGLFSAVCSAVQHAHLKGIIHRDLKPSNILITLIDGVATPKVIDFGIAKATTGFLTDKTLYTEKGQLFGTPSYMSPEQAELGGLDIDTRTDIYSLGVVLYQLLVGELPFDPGSLRKQGYAEILRILREVEPPKPSDRVDPQDEESTQRAHARRTESRALAQQLRGELDWMVLKAMDKDRGRRYETAAEFASDISRYLNHQPVVAGPPSAAYRFRKWFRRHRSGAIGTAVFVLSLAALSTFYVFDLNRQRLIAEAARAEAEAQAATATAVSNFLQDLIANADPVDADGGAITLSEVILKGADRLRSDLRDQPEVRLQLLFKLTQTLMNMDEFNAITDMLDAALPDFNETASVDTLSLDQLKINAAYALYRAGDYDNARVRFLKLLDEHESGNKAQSITHGIILRRLGLLERRSRNVELGEEYMVRAQKIYEALAEDNMQDFAGFLSDRALVLNDLKRYDEAIEANQRAIEIFEDLIGPDSPRIAGSLLNLADQQRRAGDLDAADASLDKAEAIFESNWGKDYGTSQANILMARATHANLREEFEKAVSLHRRATEIYVKELGPRHSRVAMSMSNHAVTERRRGRCDLSIALLLEARDIHTEVFGADSRWVERDNEDLAKCEYQPP